jgi:predicted amidohydrolase
MRNMALEGQLFVISACGVLTDACLDAMGLSDEQRKAIPQRGGCSGIVDPDGNYIVGPADATEQILYADADLDRIIERKLNYDTVGHYNRFDVFTLNVRTTERRGLSSTA